MVLLRESLPVTPQKMNFSPQQQTPSPSNKQRRGVRSPGARQLRRNRYINSVIPDALEKIANSSGNITNRSKIYRDELTPLAVHFIPSDPPNQFLKRPSSQAKVVSFVTEHFPIDPQQLQPYPSTGNFFVTLPFEQPESATRFIVMRFDQVFDRNTNKHLTDAWNIMNESGLSCSEKRLSRSHTPQCYVGIWEQYARKPMVTTDSKTQMPATQTVLDGFLKTLGAMVVPRLTNLLYRYDNVNWVRQQR